MALLFLFVLAGALLSAPWKEWPCFKWRKVICLSKGRSSSSPSAFFFFFNVAYTILLCLFLLHIPIRPSFSPHINPCFHPSLWWNSSINQPASEGRLHSAPCCSKGNDGVQVWLLWQQYHCYTSSSQRSLEIRCHTKSAAFNSMIIWPAVGLWSIAATVRIHTHTQTLIHSNVPLQQQLYRDLLCGCVQCSAFMDVVQMVTVIVRQSAFLPLQSLDWVHLGQAPGYWGIEEGGACRFTAVLAHKHLWYPQIFNHCFIKNPVTSLCMICMRYLQNMRQAVKNRQVGKISRPSAAVSGKSI